MRKKLLVLLTLMAVIFVCVGCGRIFGNVTKRNIKTSYPEWIKEIGLLDGKSLRITSYVEQEDGFIEIEFSCKSREIEQGFKELSEVIDKHNQFVLDNPSYFSEDNRIVIREDGGSVTLTPYFFSQAYSYYTGISDVGDDIGRCDNMLINYAYINMKGDYFKWVTSYNVNYNLPVVVMYCDGAGPTESYYSILNHFNGVEQVLLEYKTDDEVFKRIKGYVQKYAPGVEVYKYTDGHFVLIE